VASKGGYGLLYQRLFPGVSSHMMFFFVCLFLVVNGLQVEGKPADIAFA